jgi:hypothetical protein
MLSANHGNGKQQRRLKTRDSGNNQGDTWSYVLCSRACATVAVLTEQESRHDLARGPAEKSKRGRSLENWSVIRGYRGASWAW